MIVALSDAQRRTARWVGVLFLLVVLLQRVSVPNQPISILAAVVLVWVAAAMANGVVEFDSTRLTWWFALAGFTAVGMLVQTNVVPNADVSFMGWGLLMAVWLPFTVRLVERGTDTYLAALRYIVWISTALAVVALLMTGIQLAGVAYKDYFASVVPVKFQLSGFVITYPITYGSAIYKSNAFVGLEPSTVSFQMGVGLLAAPFVRARAWVLVVLILGLASTVSGSGILLFGVGLGIVVLRPARRLLLRYAAMAGIALVGVLLTPFGQLIFARSTEYQSTDSSTSLRATLPYEYLFPRWTAHASGVLLGYGPGSSQKVVTDSAITGLLVPTPVKIFFEYGLVFGLPVAAFMLLCYWGSPSSSFAITLLVSLWILQPGATASVVVIPLLILVTLWSPRSGPAIESLRSVQFAKRSDRSPGVYRAKLGQGSR